MSWGVRRTGRGALHSWMVKTRQLVIIMVIIPARASPSFHPAGPCLAGPASPTSKAFWGGVGRGGRLLAAREHNRTVAFFPRELGELFTAEQLSNPRSMGRIPQGRN